MYELGFMSSLDDSRRSPKDTRSGRLSSWDQSGRNRDYWVLDSNTSIVLGEIPGPGCIRHIWMTSFCRRILGPGIIDVEAGSRSAPVYEVHNALGLNWEATDPFYYRKVLIRISWDEQSEPSVLVPLGDFFCIGHSLPGNFASLPFTVSVKPELERTFGGQAAVNCYLPMPFEKRARLEIVNENDLPIGLYFHIDYELYREPAKHAVYYLHSQWRRESPCDGWGDGVQVNTAEVNSVANLDGKDNYGILDAEGEGLYVGCNLSVVHYQGSWWGEGDDMIFIDGESEPSISGTGSEDYFNHAWGMQKNAFPFSGSIVHEADMPGYQVSYRFHVLDPVYFSKSLRVTMEHGHANHLSDDWSSTAYWYQDLPAKPIDVLPVGQRLPPVRDQWVNSATTGPSDKIAPSEQQIEAQTSADARRRTYLQIVRAQIERKAVETKQWSQRNIEAPEKLARDWRSGKITR